MGTSMIVGFFKESKDSKQNLSRVGCCPDWEQRYHKFKG